MKKIEVVEMPDSLAASEATQNIFGVPNRQWRKWNQQSRFIFNQVYNQMEYQDSVKHPNQIRMASHHWDTIRWNASWLAAEASWHSVNE